MFTITRLEFLVECAFFIQGVVHGSGSPGTYWGYGVRLHIIRARAGNNITGGLFSTVACSHLRHDHISCAIPGGVSMLYGSAICE